MLDQFDFRIASEKYIEKTKSKISPAICYMAVWYMLSSNVSKPNLSDEELDKISLFLKEEGYYAKAGKRPRCFKGDKQDLH